MQSTLPFVLVPLALLAACGTVDSPVRSEVDPAAERATPDTPSAAPGAASVVEESDQATAVVDATIAEPPLVSEEPAVPQPEEVPVPEPTEDERVVKSDAEWRALLSPEEYRVTRQAGTERAFTGRYWDTKTIGTYECVCCKTPLFRSDTKFDSGCGWPSFFEPLEGADVSEIEDLSHGMRRTEVRCKKCDAHLGHVFNDGPPPTGLRYCINSVSLVLDPDDGDASGDGE